MPTNPLTRRGLLRLGAAAPLTLAHGAERKRILILGGTGFLGPATVEAAQARGHHLTLFNRGKTRPGLFPNIEQVHGDRDPNKGGGLKALEGGKWDAVIDNSAYYPRMVTASATLLAPNVKQYILISSISAYAKNDVEGADENSALATMADPSLEEMGKEMQYYGPLKALCEQAAERAMPKRAAVVRPGFIVGPDDPSGRFTYWPVRAQRGGEILVPGAPSDPVQFIDVRDLGAWLIHLVEQGTTGVFTATGPEKRLAWGDFLATCRRAAKADSKLVWVTPEFLEKQKVEFPIWVPYAGETRGFHTWSIARALRAGLRFRPVDDTIKDTLAWYKTQHEGGRTRLAGPSAEQETVALAAWRRERAERPA